MGNLEQDNYIRVRIYTLFVSVLAGGKEGFIMGRATRGVKTNIIAGVGAILVLGFGIWGVSYQAHQNTSSIQPTLAVATTTPTTYISYKGVAGQTALSLLKAHAKVQTKSSSLGEFVVAINGNDGGGKKYWIFYVNGQEANVGAGAYVTKTGDLVEWKLQ